MGQIGLALSGGGHRATLFSLGPLLYLADVGKNSEVRSIASVSGGSISNGYLAQAGNYDRLTAADVRQLLRPLAEQIADRGTLFSVFGTWLYLSIVMIGLIGVFSLWDVHWPWIARLGAFALGLIAWHKLLVGQRGRICAWAFSESLFSAGGRPTLLRDIAKGVNHVFCATDLTVGEHVYFAGDFVYSYRMGLGIPAEIPLAIAVQASAAFPAAFPPSILPTSQHRFEGGTNMSDRMVLTDGGVYDNMAEQWALGLKNRKSRVNTRMVSFNDVDELIVVNSSQTLAWRSLAKLQIPILGEIFALLEVVNSLYENTTSPRRTMLVDRFDSAARTRKGLRGVLIMVDQSPFTVADYFSRIADWPDRQQRANAVLTALGETRAFWKSIVHDTRQTPTTLRRLGRRRSTLLLYQSYVVAMTNLHIILDYPLLPIPALQDFESYLGKS